MAKAKQKEDQTQDQTGTEVQEEKPVTPFGKGPFLYKLLSGSHCCKHYKTVAGKEVCENGVVERGDLFYSEKDLSYMNLASKRVEKVAGPETPIDAAKVKEKAEKHTMESVMNKHSQEEIQALLEEAEIAPASNKAQSAKLLADYLNSIEGV